ncbi:MAG: type I 3-dehydroquinate dehydratase, partial [Planctomycetota bacterium]
MAAWYYPRVTLVAVPIFVSSPGDVAAALERAGRAAAAGAQLVEWRVDLLPGEEGAAEAAGRLVRESPVPCIVTCRPRSEGGSWDGDEAPRLALLAAVAGADEPPRYV